MNTEHLISNEELRELFGDSIPMDAVELLWDGSKSAGETRAALREMASALRARTPTTNESLGMAWWNHLTEQERAAWLQRSGSAVAADAWAELQRRARVPGEGAVTSAAKYLAETIGRSSWDGLGRHDGTRACDDGYDPWMHHNARPEDYRDLARAVLALLSSPPADAWRPISEAPNDQPVIVLTVQGRAFKAMRASHGDDIGMVWVTCEEDDPCPPCWTDGMCWYSNDDGQTSDQPLFWMPFHPPLDRSGQ